jgi:hypothetical protein
VPLMKKMKDSNTPEYLDEVCSTFDELARVIRAGRNR